MKKSIRPISFLLLLFLISSTGLAQDLAVGDKQQIKPFKRLNFSASAQFWGRLTDMNPGTTIQGTPETMAADISIRRFRLAASGNINDRWYIKFVLGANNLNYLNRDQVIQILDIVAFYKVNDWLYLGGGKTGYVGLSRYAAPATTSALGFDIPIFNMATVNISDDLIRRMSLVGKGRFGKLDYRIILSRPAIPTSTRPLSEYAEFERRKPELQKSAYFKYQFFDKESINSAYTPATYLGKKKILNIGAGFLHQNKTTWNISSASDTLRHDLMLLAMDFLLDIPLNNQNSKSITFYLGYFDYDFGPGYIRNIGVNNAADAVVNGSFNGRGNSFPAAGTGNISYAQFAYRFAPSNFIKGIGAIQPYFTIQIADYERLSDKMIMMDYGLNVLLNGHDSKITIGIQDRPIFSSNPSGELIETQRKFMGVIQYQVKIK